MEGLDLVLIVVRIEEFVYFGGNRFKEGVLEKDRKLKYEIGFKSVG